MMHAQKVEDSILKMSTCFTHLYSL